MLNPLISRLKFGWTKFGGARDELHKENAPEWTCQTCATVHPSHIPCFNFEIFEDEYIKICTKCKRVSKEEGITSYVILIKRTRRLDNLDSLDLV